MVSPYLLFGIFFRGDVQLASRSPQGGGLDRLAGQVGVQRFFEILSSWLIQLITDPVLIVDRSAVEDGSGGIQNEGVRSRARPQSPCQRFVFVQDDGSFESLLSGHLAQIFFGPLDGNWIHEDKGYAFWAIGLLDGRQGRGKPLAQGTGGAREGNDEGFFPLEVG